MKRKTNVSGSEFRRLVHLQFFADGADGAAAADTDGTEVDAFEQGLFGDDEGHQLDEGAGNDPSDAAPGDDGGHQPGEPPAQTTEPGTEPPEGAGDGGAADGAANNPPPQTLPLTFLGRTANVDAAAVQSLAQSLGLSTQDAIATLQKGMNYDHKNERELGVLRDFAAASNMTFDQYIGHLEQQKNDFMVNTEMQRVAAELPEDTPEAAIRRIAEANVEKQRAEQSRRAQEESQMAEKAAQEQAVSGWQALFAEHPELREPGKMPEEVFRIAGTQKCSPTEAFYRYQAQQQNTAIEQVRGELAQVKQRLAAAQKNQKNQQAAVGSMATAGDAAGDPFLDGLMSGDY